MTGPGPNKEGGEKSGRVEKQRPDRSQDNRKDGIDKSNTEERKGSGQSETREKDRKPEKPKGSAYDDANRVERKGNGPHDRPRPAESGQGGGGSYGHAESKSINFPTGKDAKTQMEEIRKKQAEDAERTKQEQRRLMSRLR